MKQGKINQEISVADQLVTEEVPMLAGQGFKSIFCHRPDGEGADQPTYHEIEAAACALGLHTQYLPVTSGKISDQDVANFAAAFQQAPKPVMAYCRSGMRAMSLWGLSQAGKMPLAEILSAGQAAGFDLSGLTLRLTGGSQHTPTDQPAHQIVIVGGRGRRHCGGLQPARAGCRAGYSDYRSGRYPLLSARVDLGGRRGV